jgi:uncharacterized protein (TIGR03790 family)
MSKGEPMRRISTLIWQIIIVSITISGLPVYSQVQDNWDSRNTSGFKVTNQKNNIFKKNYLQPDNIFVIFNKNSTYGQSIAEYYQQARFIRNNNICGINCDTSEVITRTYYENIIRDAIRDSILIRNLKNQIHFIVLTKGIPLKILGSTGSSGTQSSLDAELCLLFDNDYRLDGWINNPYFNETAHFIPNYFSYDQDTLSYLVSRLDAYNINDVFSIIDKSVNADTSGNSWYILDDYPDKWYDWMPQANEILTSLSFNVNYDTTSSPIIENPSGNVIGYCGHGVHAGNPYPFILSTLNLNYSNGAIFSTYESYNGWSFYDGPHQGNQNYISDFISAGGTGGIGHVYEPFSGGIPHEEILFARYAIGYPLIEAAYMSMTRLSWQNVVVGDPLCRININEPTILAQNTNQISKSFSLDQNYPNPFNPSTKIQFDLKRSGQVILKIYNILGEEVTTLVSGWLPAGTHSYVWNASNLASGAYIYQLKCRGFIETKKMVLMQ